MVNIDLQYYLNEVVDIIVNASTAYDIWSELQNGHKKEIYEAATDQFSVYFETCAISHLVAISTFLYSTLETRKDTYNIPRLIRQIDTSNTIPSSDLETIERKIERVKPLWIKVSKIRNEAFGHRSNEQAINTFFQNLNLKPDEIKELIDQLKEVVVDLGQLCNLEVNRSIDISAREETSEILTILSN